jgi:2,4-dienoyl-CoA reductase-like NADH-dependent reductase (Old Yellow Enzyme family)
MDRDRGNRLIAEGLANLVAFGRPYIANPEPVQRFAENAPLAEVDCETRLLLGGHAAIPITQLINQMKKYKIAVLDDYKPQPQTLSHPSA